MPLEENNNMVNNKMVEPWEIKMKKHDSTCWTNPAAETKISNPSKIHTHILHGSPDKKEKAYQFFNTLPGPTKSIMPKMNIPKPNMNYKIYQDKNRNGIPDSFEKKYNKNYKRFLK